jgi:hypothetical protein
LGRQIELIRGLFLPAGLKGLAFAALAAALYLH